MNDTKGNTEPIQVIPVTEAPTEEDINLDSSQTVADNDAIVDKASIDNSTLEASNEFNASGIENVNPQMANVQKKFQRFKVSSDWLKFKDQIRYNKIFAFSFAEKEKSKIWSTQDSGRNRSTIWNTSTPNERIESQSRILPSVDSSCLKYARKEK